MAREKFKFWLDMNKDSELLIAEHIDKLKRGRQFTATIRDGICLICDLRAGRLDVLFELFPWVRAEFLEYMNALQPKSNQSDSALQQQLARLEKLLIEQGSVPIDQVPTGPKLLAVPSVPEPIEDDSGLLTLKKSATASKQASANFLASAFSLQDG